MRTATVGIAVTLALLAQPVAQATERVATNVVLPSGLTDGQEPATTTAGGAGAAAQIEPVAAAGGALPLSLAVAVAQGMAQAPLPPPITLTLKVDLSAQRVTVMEGKVVKHVWAISSGRPGYATQTGTFRPQWTSRMWYSRQWDMAPMPHAVFFNGGTAFHATGAVGMLGRPASHGCVRLAPGNAAQLYKLVHRHGLASTKVIVHGSPRHKEPEVARRRSRDGYEQARRGGYQAYAAGGYQARRGTRSASPSFWSF